MININLIEQNCKAGFNMEFSFMEMIFKCIKHAVFTTIAACVIILLICIAPDSGMSEEPENAVPDLTKLSIEDLIKIEINKVYSASKFEQEILEAPASVSIITSSEIKQYGYRNLADILRSERGFYTTYDRNYNYIGVRGFNRPGDYNTRILLLVDGHRINDNIYGTAAIGNDFLLDVDLIERIEVIRGPSSSLYGANAFFGVINVLTKSGQNVKGIEASGETASFGTYKARATYGNKFKNDFSVLLSSSVYDSKGQSLYFRGFDNPGQNNGYADGCDYEKYKNAFAKISFKSLTLNGAFITREKGIPTAPWGITFNDSVNRSTDDRGYIDLKYEDHFANQLNLMARVYYDRMKYKGVYVSPPLNNDLALGESWGGEIQFDKSFFEKHRLTLGASYQDNFRQDQSNYDITPFLENLDDKRTSQNWALFIQDEFKIMDNLILNIGLRHDQYQTFGNNTSPRLALIYSPFEKSAIKFLYGEAFREPNMYEAFYHDGFVTQKSNPRLKPETIRTYEIAYDQYFHDKFHMTASVYYYRIRDLITQQTDTDGLDVFKNMNKVEAKGAEIEIEKKWKNNIEGRISYAFQEAKDEDTKRILTNSPKHLLKLNTAIPIIAQKLSAGIEVLYTGKRKTLQNDDANAFVTANFTLFSKNLFKNLDASASIYNLFDKKYSDPAAAEHRPFLDKIQQDGRSFRLKITYKF